MAKNRIINVKGTEINVFAKNETDFISLTDMTARFKEASPERLKQLNQIATSRPNTINRIK